MNVSDSAASSNVLQEYLGLLHDATKSCDVEGRAIRLLRAWGVYRYIIAGPMNCECCQTPVRLAIPVTSERFNGEVLNFECLCTNCTFKELAQAHRIVMQVGSARVEYPHEHCVSG